MYGVVFVGVRVCFVGIYVCVYLFVCVIVLSIYIWYVCVYVFNAYVWGMCVFGVFVLGRKLE